MGCSLPFMDGNFCFEEGVEGRTSMWVGFEFDVEVGILVTKVVGDCGNISIFV